MERCASGDVNEGLGLLFGIECGDEGEVRVLHCASLPRKSRGRDRVEGVDKMPEKIRQRLSKYGGSLMTVGWYHTHPQGGGLEPSDEDIEAQRKGEAQHTNPYVGVICTADQLGVSGMRVGVAAFTSKEESVRWEVRDEPCVPERMCSERFEDILVALREAIPPSKAPSSPLTLARQASVCAIVPCLVASSQVAISFLWR
eukprot:CAMPEP_0114112036 /NCGR_PEP_ID=MMETSP0043_2-20121206/2174_1 /TAXON_ID=464988 /ORGANISM="Hemiselmis andersenii, Strain CCMP644" /LENGTH=199 /DNA_ID=CAMNT_0001204111 /DNA_START=15 /DNA_END=611 /DNA_ORIENTATION=+